MRHALYILFAAIALIAGSSALRGAEPARPDSARVVVDSISAQIRDFEGISDSAEKVISEVDTLPLLPRLTMKRTGSRF
ncbi:MAG: hypothetical protein HDS75_04630, partial [Bacteroidales bacterium]|nr:hypothetical protein [Bacteroidales bacterium]